MSHKRHHELTDALTGEVYNVYCDSLPLGDICFSVSLVTRKQRGSARSIFYDPSDPNSVQGMLDYAAVHHTMLTLVWRYLYDHNGAFVWGKDLIELFGTAALERVRELRYKYGWPVEAKSPEGPGAWWYRMNLQPPKRRKLRKVS